MSASRRIVALFDVDAIAVQGIGFPIEVQFRVGITPRFVFDVICGGLLLRSIRLWTPMGRPRAGAHGDALAGAMGSLRFR